VRAEPDRAGPAHRPLSAASRRARRRARRRRALALLVVFLVVVGAIVGVALWATGGSTPSASTGPRSGPATAADAVPAAESGLLPWRLAAPISRTVVLPGAGAQAVILGGLNGSTSAQGVYGLDTSSGTLSQLGTLRAGLHDAGGTVLGGRYLLFGGGSPATVATVQAFALPSPGAPTRAAATVLGSLPQPRSDDAAVTIGASAYVVGGYDGTKADPEVLATTDGSTFHDVAALPVPVRYPAVAVSGGKIFVFGGQAVTAAAAPVDDIQMVDPAAGRASVVGHLPFPVAGAVAVSVGGHLYVTGGTSSTPQQLLPGVGTTQLGTAGPKNPGVGASGASTTAAVTSDTVGTIWAFDPSTGKVLTAGQLQVPVAYASAAVVGGRAWIVGGEVGATQESVVQVLSPNNGFGTAGSPGAGSPYFGYQLLVADRGNNRLLLFDAADNLKWTYPSATSPPDPLGFYFPDDAFFVRHGTAIISNQEENETIVQIAYPSGKIVWSYGHPKQTGTAPGYLHEPDDAYLLKNGQISVADAQNCRVLVLDPGGTVAAQIGTNGVCTHNPPRSIGSPNGDTPLADGNLLVSEINGSWVSEWTLSGRMVWTTHLPVTYPSDPQQIGADRYLIADYARPGAVLEFDRSGQVLSRYQPSSGPGMLDHPSLSELLPSGAIMINDDYSNRMVAIDPATGALVWQYGQTDNAGTGPGMLNTPDGFDLLGPGGSTPTHPATG
jgi:outer membrane protein assembly factor BamB